MSRAAVPGAERTAKPGRGRLRPASLGVTLLLFNVLLVFLPLVGVMFLGSFEARLLTGLERTLSEQGLMLAAALEEGAGAAGTAGADESFAGRAARLVARLERRHEARVRVFDAAGMVVADSAGVPAPAEPAGETGLVKSMSLRSAGYAEPSPTPAADGRRAAEESLLYRVGAWPVRTARSLVGWLLGAPRPAGDLHDLYEKPGPHAAVPELAAALAGSYGATSRVVGSDGTSRLVLYTAQPVRPDGGAAPVGAVLVSQSTSRILADLYLLRLDIFRVFLWAVAIAAGLSVALTLAITRPLGRLARQAAGLVDERGRLTGSFGPVRAHHEIAVLARSLEEMRRGLARNAAFLDAVGGELEHELRNPLASARASLELLGSGEADPGRRVLYANAQADLRRIGAIATDFADWGRADAGGEPDAGAGADLAEVLRAAVTGCRLRHPGVDIRLAAAAAEGAVLAGVPAERLAQAVDHLLENAVSFTPPGGVVELAAEPAAPVEGGRCRRWRITVRDQGPGFDPADAERLFTRFYSTRKGDGHTGLGLAVVKSLAERWGGRAWAENAGPGARFVLELPERPEDGRG